MYLNEFKIFLNEDTKYAVKIVPYNNLSYEIEISMDEDMVIKEYIDVFFENFMMILEPDFAVAGLEQSVLIANESNFLDEGNIYKFYTSNLNLEENLNIENNGIEVKSLKNGILFTNIEFLKLFENYFINSKIMK